MVMVLVIAICSQSIFLIVILMSRNSVMSFDLLDVLGGTVLLFHPTSAGGWRC
jgi:hypothetical protein